MILASPGSDNDNLKNVVVGLTPSTSYNGEKYTYI